MEKRDKLIKIISKVKDECHIIGACNECTIKGCQSVRIADAIIESGLLKDEKVYKPKLNCIDCGIRRYECSNCGREVTGCNYCFNCGVRVKEDSN